MGGFARIYVILSLYTYLPNAGGCADTICLVNLQFPLVFPVGSTCTFMHLTHMFRFQFQYPHVTYAPDFNFLVM